MEPGPSALRAFFGRGDPVAPVLIAVASGAWTTRNSRVLARRAGWRIRRIEAPPERFVASLGDRRRARLRCLAGPAALAAEPELPGARTCTVVRQPSDVVAAGYYLAKAQRSPHEPGDDELLALLAALPLDRVYERFAEDGAAPSEAAFRRFTAYCNPQARMLLAGDGHPPLPITAGPPADADAWRERLWAAVGRLDAIARHDAFDPVVARLTTLPDGPALAGKDDAPGTAAAQLLPAAAEAVRAYNWLDRELYERAGPELPKPTGRSARSGPAGIGGRRVELVFDAGGQGERPPIGVFQHLAKTGGSSLKRMLCAAVPAASVERLWTPHHPGPPRTVDEWYRDLAAELGPRLSRLRFCSAHSANFLLPYLERDVVPICIVRDAVDRAVSHYAFDNPGADAAVGLAEVYATHGGGSPRDSREAHKRRIFFNYQARALLAPEHDVDELGFTAGPPADADRWRAVLFATAQRYVVGTTERFADATRRFGAATGVELAVEVREKVNPHRPRVADLDPGLAEEIRAYNWLDAELHAAFAAS